MNNFLSNNILFFLEKEIGLEQATIELGIKLSIKNKIPLPISLFSHGLLTVEELDKLYSYLFQNIE